MSEKKVFHNIIDGEVQASASGAMMDIINPSTGEVYATAPNSDAARRRPGVPGRGQGVREVALVARPASGRRRCSSSPT